jgi:hypothetical protein
LDQLIQAARELSEENTDQVTRQIADQAGPQEMNTSEASSKQQDSISITAQMAKSNSKAP